MNTKVFSPMRGVARLALPACALAGLLALEGCASVSSLGNEPASAKGFLAWIAPYKPDIVQGNVVTSEQIALVKPGMSRAQVRDILGTPLITDPFHAERWDYVFTMKRQGFDDQRRAFTVLFQGDAVQKVDAPALPTEDAFVAQISRHPLPKKVPTLELTPAQIAALPHPAPAPAATQPAERGASAPLRTYPPLEQS